MTYAQEGFLGNLREIKEEGPYTSGDIIQAALKYKRLDRAHDFLQGYGDWIEEQDEWERIYEDDTPHYVAKENPWFGMTHLFGKRENVPYPWNLILFPLRSE